jgi:pimeloyl-ACP methyl ester carboxylesterase
MYWFRTRIDSITLKLRCGEVWPEEFRMRTVNISNAIFLGMALLLASQCGAQQAAKDVPMPPPFTSVPTFSTANIARQGHFYVGGKWVGEPGHEIMRGAMYVETWVPKKIRFKYPILFIQSGGGETNVALLQTPDGRPGWAYDFVNRGYVINMMDLPGRGRSAYVPGVDGELIPPRSGPLMEEVWSGARPPSTPQSSWPQATKHTQWPGDGPNKGKMGDPIFDYFAKTDSQAPTGKDMEQLSADDIVALVDLIHGPVVLLLHSGVAPSGWLVADARPKMVKGIIAAEPVAPPIVNAERGATGPGRVWGLTNMPITYDPPIKSASELSTVREDKADGPDLIPCWVQKEPARKLINLEGIPVLDVSGEASYHRPYAHCVAKWLNQAGGKATFVRLEDVGIRGNGHQFMSEKNSAEISKFFMDWLEKNVQ